MKKQSLPGFDRLELLQSWVSMVESGSLSAAALQMGTTQPTMSRRLKQLEAHWGVQLLRRTTHSMALTADGERCFRQAKELLEQWHVMDADLRGSHAALRGALRVVAPSVFGQEQLVGPLAQFLHAHPEVSVEWLLYDRLPDFVGEGVDCAIRVGKVEEPNLVALPLAEVPRLVVAAPGLLAAYPLVQHPDDLARLPWLSLQTFYRDEVTLFHRDRTQPVRIPIQSRLSTDSLQAVRNAALAGLGVCVASRWAVAQDIKAGRLVPVLPQWAVAPLPLYLVLPQSSYRSARLRGFIDAMKADVPHLEGLAPTSSGGKGTRRSSK
jgi:DNA-binding transcriptional LysR family regulator